jgi:hypothetical protein
MVANPWHEAFFQLNRLEMAFTTTSTAQPAESKSLPNDCAKRSFLTASSQICWGELCSCGACLGDHSDRAHLPCMARHQRKLTYKATLYGLHAKQRDMIRSPSVTGGSEAWAQHPQPGHAPPGPPAGTDDRIPPGTLPQHTHAPHLPYQKGAQRIYLV